MPFTRLPYEYLVGLEEPLVSDQEFLWSPIYLPLYGDKFTGTKGTLDDYSFAIFRNGQSDFVSWNIMPPSGIEQVVLNIIWSPTASQTAAIKWEILAQEWIIGDVLSAGLYVSNYQDFFTSYVINGIYKNIMSVNLTQLHHPIDFIKLRIRRLGSDDGASFNARVLGFSVQYTR